MEYNCSLKKMRGLLLYCIKSSLHCIVFFLSCVGVKFAQASNQWEARPVKKIPEEMSQTAADQ
jgi:hypothetical protein